jgi:DNA-binding CsgD family transcriptional regulator
VLSRQNALSAPVASSSDTATLSRRQQEVARWIREGKSNVEIARIMGISPRTVQKHIEHIFDKLGVESRVAVATHQLHNGGNG